MGRYTTIKVILAILTLVIIYLLALNGRYMQMEKTYVFDKWTKSLLVPDKDGNYTPLEKMNN